MAFASVLSTRTASAGTDTVITVNVCRKGITTGELSPVTSVEKRASECVNSDAREAVCVHILSRLFLFFRASVAAAAGPLVAATRATVVVLGLVPSEYVFVDIFSCMLVSVNGSLNEKYGLNKVWPRTLFSYLFYFG